MNVRAAAEADLPQLTDIYNHFVRTSQATFDVEPFTVEARREWFSHYADAGRHRLLVAADGDLLLGYATSSRWRTKPGYDGTVETTVYTRPEAIGRGVGKALYQALFEALAGEEIHRVVAGIVPPTEASFRLHAAFGFREVGRFSEVGWKFGRHWDVVWLERPLALSGVIGRDSGN